jgi:anti-sigma-K factor RskA
MTDDAARTPARPGEEPPTALGFALGAEDEQEARSFEEVAEQLALAAEPVLPRPELKTALFAAIRTTPQVPAATQPRAAEPLRAQAPAPTEAALPTALTTPAPADSAPPAASPAERDAQRRWFSRPLAIAAAAAAAVVLFAGGMVVGSALAGHDSAQHQQASALAAINAAPDARRATAAVDGGGTATLIWSPTLHTSALIASDLPTLPDDKTYELWYIRDGKATPAGTMTSTESGSSWRVLSGTMRDGDTVGVTVEPSGGSPRPTTAPIVAIPS